MDSAPQNLQQFPRELLAQPIPIRQAYFEKKFAKHHILEQVHTKVLHAIRHPAGASLINVFGPTGVGKSTLLNHIAAQLIKDAAADPTTTPGHIPVVWLSAAAHGDSPFKWKDFSIRALEKLDEPCLADKITYQVRGIHRDSEGRLVIERAAVSADLRLVLEKCLLHRRLYAFLLDEAQHLKKVASGKRLLDQMDAIKSLAELSKTLFVLFGTYELMGLRNLSGQLGRRTIEIHFPRYHIEKEKTEEEEADIVEFVKVLRTFQRHLPFPEEPNLVEHYEYFYEMSLGCIGILKDWLSRSLAAALEQNESTLTEKRWKEHVAPPGQLGHIINEIITGETALQTEAENAAKLREQLKFPTVHPLPTGSSPTPEQSPSQPPEQPEQAETPQSAPGSSEPRGKRRERPVGQQNPRRNKVGKEQKSAG